MNLTKIGNNMTELKLGRKVILFSYDTPVALYDYTTHEYIKTSRVFSPTTTRHVAKWLGDHTAAYVDQAFFNGLIAGVR